MTNHILRAALWLLILTLLLTVFSWMFFPKDNLQKAGVSNETIAGYLTEPENTLDILVLGDSLPFTGFNPWTLWSSHGFTAYVCSANGQNTLHSLEYLRQFSRRQRPRAVILETNHLYYEYTEIDRLSRWFEEKIPVLRYHDNWKTVPLSAMLRPVCYTGKPAAKGCRYSRTTLGLQEAGRQPWEDQPLDPPACVISTLEEMTQLCAEMDAQLILVSMPSAISWEPGRREPLEKLAEHLGVPYLEMNSLDLGIDWETDTIDGGDHLNGQGAEKASRFLADYICQVATLQDHRGDPAYAQWNLDYAHFLELLETTEGTIK